MKQWSEEVEEVEEVDHEGQGYFNFDEPSKEPFIRPNFEEDYLTIPGEAIVNKEMRTLFFKSEGWYAPDKVVLKWYNKATEGFDVDEWAKETRTLIVEPITEEKQVSDGGGGQNYYDLPNEATQLLDLIEHRNMNGNIKDIFKACYRLGLKEGITEEYDLRKMVIYSIRELGRVLGRKDYVTLAREVVGHHDRNEAERLTALTH